MLTILFNPRIVQGAVAAAALSASTATSAQEVFSGTSSVGQALPLAAVSAREVFSATSALTAAKGTSASNAREVFSATSTVTAAKGTSAANAREVYQGTSALTAAKGTSAASDREVYGATSALSAAGGTSSISSSEVFAGQTFLLAAPATSQAAAAESNIPQAQPETSSGGGTSLHFHRHGSENRIIRARSRVKAKKAKSAATAQQTLPAISALGGTSSVSSITARHCPIIRAKASFIARKPARTRAKAREILRLNSPYRYQGRPGIASPASSITGAIHIFDLLEEEWMALMLAA